MSSNNESDPAGMGVVAIGCLIFFLWPIWLLLFFELGKSEGAGVALFAFVCTVGVVFFLLIICVQKSEECKKERELEEERRKKEQELERERRKKERELEEERFRNSPEEVKRRKLEEERRRVEREEIARQQKLCEEKWAHEKWNEYHRSIRIEEIDEMDGIQFEQFIKKFLEKTGYTDVRDTPVSGDQGADIVCLSPDGKKSVIQTKRWKNVVSNSAVQELLGALLFYGADIGTVITNSRFTNSAKELASKDGRISLVEGSELFKAIRKAFPREIPEFDWDEYHRIVKNRGTSCPINAIKLFDKSPVTGEQVQLLEGRYGFYVADGQTNASIPRTMSTDEVTFERALDLLATRAAKKPAKKKKRRKKRYHRY